MKNRMNLKRGIALILLSLITTVVYPQGYTTVGICDGLYADGQHGTATGRPGEGTVDCAVKFRASLFDKFRGMDIVGVRVAMAGNVVPQTVVAWVRESLDGENLAESEPVAVTEGWNEINFSPGSLPVSDKDLYFGYSFSQQSRINCISLAGANTDPDGSWTKARGTWKSHSNLNSGNISLEALLTGGDMRSNDLRITCLEPREKMMVAAQHSSFLATVYNASSYQQGYTIHWEAERGDSGDYHVDSAPKYCESQQVEVPFDLDSVMDGGRMTLTATVILDGTDDETPSDNTASAEVDMYMKAFDHITLYEEFGTEKCIYCPAAAERVRKVIADKGYEDRVVWVGHHAGYHYDSFTTGASMSYEWFYPSDRKEAPGSMIDRCRFERCFDGSIVFTPSSEEIIGEYLTSRVESPAFARIQGIATPGEDGSIELTLRMRRLEGASNTERLTVLVLEKDVPAVAQTGQEGYIHEPMVRTALSDEWGDTLPWQDNMCETSYTLRDIPSDWKVENLSFVAFLSNYNASDKYDCRISNSLQVGIDYQGNAGFEPEMPDDYYRHGDGSGVPEAPLEMHPVTDRYYDLSGLQVNPRTAKGFLIRVRTYEDGHTESSKIMKF